ncbi:MAG TPA: hypothetical protein P5307_20020 [Pirellulaceae bacterium]|nr:hypothetical protein [Planctomycetales bacterium]MCB9941355.1 hypothetical protein [Planctomycetaceae bacterium]HRX81372.1 hypothetical protein [Pirellulaceae bacterium]
MRFQLLTLALIATLVGAPAVAGDNGCDGKHDGHGKGGHRAYCPHCGDACYPTVTKGKETKTCWNVESVAICIPKVRFPWESNCGKGCGGKDCGKENCVPPKCGRTKYVNVLMKHEYECSTCKYSWDVDSYKNGDDKRNKAFGYDEPSNAAPTVSEPPPVEASLPQSNRRVAPAAFEQSGDVTPAKKSYLDSLMSFFK